MLGAEGCFACVCGGLVGWSWSFVYGCGLVGVLYGGSSGLVVKHGVQLCGTLRFHVALPIALDVSRTIMAGDEMLSACKCYCGCSCVHGC